MVISYQPKKTVRRRMGKTALAVFESIPQSHIHNNAYKRQTERLPCRHRQAGAGVHVKAFRADETGVGITEQLKAGQCCWHIY